VFGGAWRSVALVSTLGPLPSEASARGADDGAYALRVATGAAAPLTLVLHDPDGPAAARHEARGPVLDVAGASPESAAGDPGLRGATSST
jgi:hypothetical protein